jgi:8-oxo-dGTP diphosphatase
MRVGRAESATLPAVATAITRADSFELIDRIHRWVFWCGYRALLASRLFRNPLGHGAYVAVWSNGRLLLIRNSYRSGDTLPAGGLKRGESHREAARRELAEEVGIEIAPDDLEFVCEVEITSRYGRDRSQFFELHFEHDPSVAIDRREVIDWDFCAAEDLAGRPLHRIVRRYLKLRSAAPAPAQ